MKIDVDEEGDPDPARARGGLARTAACIALTAFLVACSTTPSTTPGAPVPSPSTFGSSTADATAAPSASAVVTEPLVSPGVTPTAAPTAAATAASPVLPASGPAVVSTDFTCTGTIGPSDPVAVVRLQAKSGAEGALVLRDYADPTAPRTACTFLLDEWRIVRLLDSRHIIVSAEDEGGLYAVADLTDSSYRWFQLPASKSGYSPQLVAVAPTMDQIVWLSLDPEGTKSDALHVTTASGGHIVATLPDTNLGRCSDPDDSNLGAFRRSGSLDYVLNAPLPAEASLLVLDKNQIQYSVIAPKRGWPDGGWPAMAVWSPVADTLYYRQGADVSRWTRADGRTTFLHGVRWSYPTISPDGTHLAYQASRSDGSTDVYLIDLAKSGSPQRLGSGRRGTPAFLNDTQLWYVNTSGVGGCAGGPGKEQPLVYNLKTKSEASSLITRVLFTWPATSSNL